MAKSGLAEAILSKKGIKPTEEKKPTGTEAFDAVADELYHALESKDRKAFRSTLRAMLDVEKAEGGG